MDHGSFSRVLPRVCRFVHQPDPSCPTQQVVRANNSNPDQFDIASGTLCREEIQSLWARIAASMLLIDDSPGE